MTCEHEWEFSTSDYGGVRVDDEWKDAYIEEYNCIHCNATMKEYYVYHSRVVDDDEDDTP